MEDDKIYLDKVVICSDEGLIGEYRPGNYRNIFQQKSLKNNCHYIDIEELLVNKHIKQNVKYPSKKLKKSPSCPKKNGHRFKIDNVHLHCFKNENSKEFILFLTRDFDLNSDNTIYLDLSRKFRPIFKDFKTNSINNNCPTNKSSGEGLNIRYKRKRKPRNFKKTLGFDNVFEKVVKNWLSISLHSQQRNISATAVFNTENAKKSKIFFLQEIDKKKDVKIFMKMLNNMTDNNNQNLPVQNVCAFIIVNQSEIILFLELTNFNRRYANQNNINSHIIEFNNRKYINAKFMNVKLRNVKWYVTSKRFNKYIHVTLNDSKSNTEPNNGISYETSCPENIYNTVKSYKENIDSHCNILAKNESNGKLQKGYNILVELQSDSSTKQCDELYLNYFTNQNCFKNVLSKLCETVKNVCCLFARQKPETDSKIVNVNKFFMEITEHPLINNRCSQSQICRYCNMTREIMPSTIVIKFQNNITSKRKCKLSKEISNRQHQIQDNYTDNSKINTISSLLPIRAKENTIEINLKDVKLVIGNIVNINECFSPNVNKIVDIFIHKNLFANNKIGPETQINTLGEHNLISQEVQTTIGTRNTDYNQNLNEITQQKSAQPTIEDNIRKLRMILDEFEDGSEELSSDVQDSLKELCGVLDDIHVNNVSRTEMIDRAESSENVEIKLESNLTKLRNILLEKKEYMLKKKLPQAELENETNSSNTTAEEIITSLKTSLTKIEQTSNAITTKLNTNLQKMKGAIKQSKIPERTLTFNLTEDLKNLGIVTKDIQDVLIQNSIPIPKTIEEIDIKQEEKDKWSVTALSSRQNLVKIDPSRLEIEKKVKHKNEDLNIKKSLIPERVKRNTPSSKEKLEKLNIKYKNTMQTVREKYKSTFHTVKEKTHNKKVSKDKTELKSKVSKEKVSMKYKNTTVQALKENYRIKIQTVKETTSYDLDAFKQIELKSNESSKENLEKLDVKHKNTTEPIKENNTNQKIENSNTIQTKEGNNNMQTKENKNTTQTKENNNNMQTKENNKNMQTKEYYNTIQIKEKNNTMQTQEYMNNMQTKENNDTVQTEKDSNSIQTIENNKIMQTKENNKSIQTTENITMQTKENKRAMETKVKNKSIQTTENTTMQTKENNRTMQTEENYKNMQTNDNMYSIQSKENNTMQTKENISNIQTKEFYKNIQTKENNNSVQTKENNTIQTKENIRTTQTKENNYTMQTKQNDFISVKTDLKSNEILIPINYKSKSDDDFKKPIIKYKKRELLSLRNIQKFNDFKEEKIKSTLNDDLKNVKKDTKILASLENLLTTEDISKVNQNAEAKLTKKESENKKRTANKNDKKENKNEKSERKNVVVQVENIPVEKINKLLIKENLVLLKENRHKENNLISNENKLKTGENFIKFITSQNIEQDRKEILSSNSKKYFEELHKMTEKYKETNDELHILKQKQKDAENFFKRAEDILKNCSQNTEQKKESSTENLSAIRLDKEFKNEQREKINTEANLQKLIRISDQMQENILRKKREILTAYSKKNTKDVEDEESIALKTRRLNIEHNITKLNNILKENEKENEEIQQMENKLEESLNFEDIKPNIKENLEKFSGILDDIKDEKVQKVLSYHIQENLKKLDIIPEEDLTPKKSKFVSEVTTPEKRKEILNQIQKTLERVTSKMEKNAVIIHKVTDLKRELRRIIESKEEKPRLLKMPIRDVDRIYSCPVMSSVRKTKEEITKNLNNSLLLLKSLNEVIKNAKSNPANAMKKLTEIEISLKAQTAKCKKLHLSLSPPNVKNFISENKININNLSLRSSGSNKSKLFQISPKVNSKYIVDCTNKKILMKQFTAPCKSRDTPRTYRPRSKASSRSKSRPASHQSRLSSRSSGQGRQIRKEQIQPVVQTTRQLKFFKIYRPVKPKDCLSDVVNMTNLTLSNFAPFESEYPRKDNLSHIDIQNTYLYKLIHNELGERTLEPLIKCPKPTNNVTKKPSKKCSGKVAVQTEPKVCKKFDISKWRNPNWDDVIRTADMAGPSMNQIRNVIICPVKMQASLAINERAPRGVRYYPHINNEINRIRDLNLNNQLKPRNKSASRRVSTPLGVIKKPTSSHDRKRSPKKKSTNSSRKSKKSLISAFK